MSNQLTPPKAQQRQPITAAGMNELLRAVLRRIRGGSGIRVEQYGDGIVIHGGAGGRGSSGGLSIPWVTDLPPIPTDAETTLMVYWATSGEMSGASGDGQVWVASTGKDRWRPLEKYTSNGGVPPGGS